jgi:hypothetical protein
VEEPDYVNGRKGGTGFILFLKESPAEEEKRRLIFSLDFIV